MNLGLALPPRLPLLLGDFEAGDPVPPELARRLREEPGVVLPGFVPDTAPYYPLMDVLAFPPHREGFPNAPLEAAAAGVPTVGSRATGVVDAVGDGETGTLVPVGDGEAMARALLHYLRNAGGRKLHGEAARERVKRSFRREVVWAAWEGELRKLLGGAGPTAHRLDRPLTGEIDRSPAGSWLGFGRVHGPRKTAGAAIGAAPAVEGALRRPGV